MAGRSIQDGDLQAYVDGWLDPERRLEVEHYLARDPEAAARVHAYRAQTDALHALFDPVLDEPAPEETKTLGDRLAGRLAGNDNERRGLLSSPWLRSAAAIVLVASGMAGGWLLRGDAGAPRPQAPPLQEFAQQAVQAHAFYTASRFAVEMDAADPGALDSWLSQRLGRTVSGPDLTQVGYRLIGGRSLPTATGPGVQYMYENDEQRRLTLFVSMPRGGQASAFSFVQREEVSMFYWQEGALAYALIGKADRDELLGVAQAVYRGQERRSGEAASQAAQQPPTAAPQRPANQPASPGSDMRTAGEVTAKPM